MSPVLLLSKQKKVEQVDSLTNKVVEVFPSAEAAAKAHGLASSTKIYSAISGTRRFCVGYRWRYQVSQDEISDVTKSRNPECTCYLIASLNPLHPHETYIGLTVDPPRRIRQHNGERQGGANTTILARPWECRAVVTGFPCYQTCHNFEQAWIKQTKYRPLRKMIGHDAVHKIHEYCALDRQFALLKALLIACPQMYGDVPLRVYFLQADDLETFRNIEVEGLPANPSLSDFDLRLVSDISEAIPYSADTLPADECATG